MTKIRRMITDRQPIHAGLYALTLECGHAQTGYERNRVGGTTGCMKCVPAAKVPCQEIMRGGFPCKWHATHLTPARHGKEQRKVCRMHRRRYEDWHHKCTEL